MVRVRDLAPRIPSMVVNVYPEGIPGGPELVEKRPIPIEDEIDLSVHPANFRIEAREPAEADG